MKTSQASIKKFDAVKMMREIRDRIDEETRNMSFEELKLYYRKGSDKNKGRPEK